MPYKYDTPAEDQQEMDRQTAVLSEHLETYLQPLLTLLDAYLDRRLVRTFFEGIVAILRFRNPKQGLILSELGAYIANGKHAEAGSKRVEKLLQSKKWEKRIIERWLLDQAKKVITRLKAAEEVVLCIWDESVIEKPESEKTEGLSVVRSSKAKRLRKRRKGVYNQPGGMPVHVRGMEWASLLIVGMYGVPTVATMEWWKRKEKDDPRTRTNQKRLLLKVALKWGRDVIHVFDRGYAGVPWLELLSALKQRFVTRWQKGYALLDQEGNEKKAWEIARGKRTWEVREMWDAQHHCYRKTGIVAMPVRHTKYEGTLYLVVVRRGKEPWYLITNEEVKTKEQAWEIARIYARRWQIELTFRYGKSELAMESPRLWKWEMSEKLLLMVTMVYAYLLSLIDDVWEVTRKWLLSNYCQRRGKRLEKVRAPLYRMRWALSRLWNEQRPIFYSNLFTPLREVNMRS